MEAGLREMLDEDPTLTTERDESTGAVTVGAPGELQLEIVLDRLKRDCQVAAVVDRVTVAYRETLTCAAEGEGKVASHVGGRGEYAHAKIRVCPGEPGSGFVVHNDVIGGTIPDRFVEPVHVDGIVADLSGRRGQIRADAAGGGRCIVRALVPLTELLGYGAAFRSRTGGRGTYVMQFDRYVPFDPEMNGDDRTSGVGAPLKPRPKLRDSAIALPEPDDERDEI